MNLDQHLFLFPGQIHEARSLGNFFCLFLHGESLNLSPPNLPILESQPVSLAANLVCSRVCLHLGETDPFFIALAHRIRFFLLDRISACRLDSATVRLQPYSDLRHSYATPKQPKLPVPLCEA